MSSESATNGHNHQDSPTDDSPKTKIYIGNLPEHTTLEDLQDCFGQLGEVKHIDLKRSYGFVDYVSPQSAIDAVAKYHEGHFLGFQIKVEISHGVRRDRIPKAVGPPETTTCFTCGRTGHYARDCPDASSQDRDKRSNRRDNRPEDRRSERNYKDDDRDYGRSNGSYRNDRGGPGGGGGGRRNDYQPPPPSRDRGPGYDDPYSRRDYGPPAPFYSAPPPAPYPPASYYPPPDPYFDPRSVPPYGAPPPPPPVGSFDPYADRSRPDPYAYGSDYRGPPPPRDDRRNGGGYGGSGYDNDVGRGRRLSPRGNRGYNNRRDLSPGRRRRSRSPVSRSGGGGYGGNPSYPPPVDYAPQPYSPSFPPPVPNGPPRGRGGGRRN